jgi:putative ABC transport system substrate-binding protein
MQLDQLRRRDFISLLGGAATWPLAARAQQAAMPVIGVLSGTALPEVYLPAFQQGLSEAGYIEGKNVTIEYRSAAGEYDRLPALAADFVRRQVAVIAAVGTSAPGLAAKSATSVIPVVFQTGGDPVQDGLVSRMNRPGGNVTGVSRLSVALEPKRLELLHEVVPKATVLGLLVNPLNPRTQVLVQQMRQPAHSLGFTLNVLEARTESELARRSDLISAEVRVGDIRKCQRERRQSKPISLERWIGDGKCRRPSDFHPYGSDRRQFVHC